MADDELLICMPWGRHTVLGSTTKECCDCNRTLGVAPSGVRIIAEHGAVPICPECALERMRNDPDPQVQAIRPDQLREMAEHAARERRN